MTMTGKLWLQLLVVLVLSACAQGSAEIKPPEIQYGEDLCAECDMIISDARFAAGYAYEVEPGRYESLAFDDIGDMLAHADRQSLNRIVAWYVHDFDSSETLDATSAHYVFSNQLQTPMGQGTSAHATLESAEQMAAELDGEVLDWEGLLAKARAGALMITATAAMDQTHAHDHEDVQSEAPVSAVTLHEQEMHDHDQLIVIGQAEGKGYALEMVAIGPLHVGYNDIMLHLSRSDGEAIGEAEITLAPLMTMFDGKNHTAAVEQPVSEMNGMAHAALIFPMASGPDLGNWTVDVAVSDPANAEILSSTFDIDVAPSKLSASMLTVDDRKIFLAVVEPSIPAVGAQPLEIFAYEKLSMSVWPTLDDLSLSIEPEMPTMGHGSPNNVDPTFVRGGHYVGIVNFSMAGPWTVTVTASEDNELLGEVVLEFDVPETE